MATSGELSEELQRIRDDIHEFLMSGESPEERRWRESLRLLADWKRRAEQAEKALRGLLDGVKATGRCVCFGNDKQGHEEGCQVVEARKLVG